MHEPKGIGHTKIVGQKSYCSFTFVGGTHWVPFGTKIGGSPSTALGKVVFLQECLESYLNSSSVALNSYHQYLTSNGTIE
jgi:hypothetical protein